MTADELRTRVEPLLADVRASLSEIRELFTDPEAQHPGGRDWMPARFKADAVPGIEPIWERVADAVAPLTEDDDPSLRRRALGVLQLVPSDTSRLAFRSALEWADANAVYAAINGLVDQADATVAETLEARLQESDPFVRLYVAAGLGQLGETSAASAIESALDAEMFTFVKAWQARALAELTGAAATPKLIALALAPDTDALLFQGVQQALLHIGEAAVPALREALESVGDKDIQQRLIDLLFRLGADVDGALARFIATATKPGERIWAASLLALKGEARVVPLLLEHYFEPAELLALVRPALLEMPSDLDEALISVLRDDTSAPLTTAAAADVAGHRGLAHGCDDLRSLVDHDEGRVALAAISSLARLGAESDALDALNRLLSARPAPIPRGVYVNNLAHLAGPTPLPILDRLIEDPSAGVVGIAIELLGLHSPDASEPRLRALLESATGAEGLPSLEADQYGPFVGLPGYVDQLVEREAGYRQNFPAPMAAEMERIDRAVWSNATSAVVAGALLVTAKQQIVACEPSVEALFEHPAATIRLRAARALAAMSTRDLEARFAPLRDDAEPLLRYLASAFWLTEAGIERLVRDASPAVRESLVQKLVEERPASVRTWLEKLAADDVELVSNTAREAIRGL